MTSNIQIGKYIVKPYSVRWNSSVLNIEETCKIALPRSIYLKSNLNVTDNKKIKPSYSSVIFSEGDAVSVSLGYDNQNVLVFEGFVNRINQTERLELECLGYSYKLPKVFNKTYKNTTVKAILSDLVAGTDIQISKYVPDVTVKSVRFKNASGLQVLEFFQRELLLTVYFNFKEIYAGLRYGYKKNTVKIKLGWNTVDDKDFKQMRTQENVLIRLVDKNSKGEVKKTKADYKKYSQTKDIKIRSGMEDSLKSILANDIQNVSNYQGYQGKVVCFLIPHIEKSDVVQVTDDRFPERSGSYFCESVDGEFSTGGGRQNITLNYYGGN